MVEKTSEGEVADGGNRGLRFLRGNGRRGGVGHSASPCLLRSTPVFSFAGAWKVCASSNCCI